MKTNSHMLPVQRRYSVEQRNLCSLSCVTLVFVCVCWEGGDGGGKGCWNGRVAGWVAGWSYTENNKLLAMMLSCTVILCR